MAKLPHEGAGWRYPFIGPWLAGATSIQSFHMMACTPSPFAVAVGVWFGSLHLMASLFKPTTWAPGLGEGRPGIPHGGRKGGRRRGPNTPKAKFRPVWNLPAETEFPLDNGLKYALFEIGSLALEAGYILFLADLFRDSLIIGTSAAYRYEGCTPWSFGPATATFDGAVWVPGDYGRTPFTATYDPSNLLAVNRWRVPAGTGCAFDYSIGVEPFSGAPHDFGPVEFFLFDETGGSVVSGAGGGPPAGWSGGAYSAGNHSNLPVSDVDRVYSLYSYASSGYAQVSAGSQLYVGDGIQLIQALGPDP